ncbi:MFS transporter, partial [Cupriavidus pinatubonensis]
AGGPAPLIATALFARYHSGYAIAFYVLVCAGLSVFAATQLRDYTKKDISREYDEPGFAHDGGNTRHAT